MNTPRATALSKALVPSFPQAGRARVLSTACLLVGSVTLALAVTGLFVGTYEGARPRPGERFTPALAARARSLSALAAEARNSVDAATWSTPQGKMTALHGIVADRFTHNAGARHTWLSNWLLRAAGVAHPVLGTIWSADALVRRGESLVCSQASYVLLQLATAEGLIARHVGLNGHVVMEAWYESAWHLFDPDAEVLVRTPEGAILGVEALIHQPDLLRAAYADNYVRMFLSQEDNTFVSLPQGAYFEWKSEAMKHVERLTEVLKLVLPVLFLLVGFAMRRKSAPSSKPAVTP